MTRVGLILLALTMFPSDAAYAQLQLPASPVVRSTDDCESDLIETLIRLGRFDDALQVCRPTTSTDLERTGERDAKRAITISQILTARQMTQATFDDRAIALATEPVASFLSSIPDHPRRIFLNAQSIAVQRAAARFAILASAVASSGRSLDDTALASVVRAGEATRELADEVADTRSRLQTDRELASQPMISDLIRLERELLVESVSLALLQTESFSGSSPASHGDVIAAATAAERAAEQALTKLPNDSQARIEITRLKIEAVLRAGQSQQASDQYDLLVQSTGTRPLSPAMLSLRVRIDLAADALKDAEHVLHQFFGDDPERASISVEMDLARLAYLLAEKSSDTDSISRWIELIGHRNGPYATRRAEVMALSKLRSSDGETVVDASLIAAQGRDWLRRGESGRAAELLTAAATSDTNPTRGIRHAIEAAALWKHLGQTNRAAEILETTAINNADADNAAAIHLQSILLRWQLTDSPENDQRREQIKNALRLNIDQWPTNATATSARSWLTKILDSEGDLVGAAESATRAVGTLTTDGFSVSFELWQEAFLKCDERTAEEVSRRFYLAFAAIERQPAVEAGYRRAIATLAARDRLTDLPVEASDAEYRFFVAITVARRTGAFGDPFPEPPITISERMMRCLRRRLMIDARSNPASRAGIAALLERWHEIQQGRSGDVDIDGRAERLLWLERTEEAIDLLQNFIASDSSSIQPIERAAQLLASSTDDRARGKAIELFDRIATGSARGTLAWHEAKIDGIELMLQTNRSDEARRRAEYILLTMPGLDETWRQKYDQLAK